MGWWDKAKEEQQLARIERQQKKEIRRSGPRASAVGKVEDLELFAGDLDRPYTVIGPVTGRVGAATAFSKSPTIEDASFKLQEAALKLGANAVINVTYDRGVSATSWKALTAKGTAVIAESTEIKCPYCAELVKREAIKCKHCGSDLS
jgi:hypothetical protein